VDRCRELAVEEPDVHRPCLGIVLHDLGVRFNEIGRHEDALAAVQEATNLYRELAAAEPDAHLPGLATALNAPATFLSEVGQRRKALARGGRRRRRTSVFVGLLPVFFQHIS
jgi:hypothetical protein